MGESEADSAAVKRRLVSLYESSPPQLFSHLLVDYDPARRELKTEAARVYDLRAAARVQILFADGFRPAAAIEFLREAIRHIEECGLPAADGPVSFPDGGAAGRQAEGGPPPPAGGGQVGHGPRAEAAGMQRGAAPPRETPTLPALAPASSALVPRETRQREELEATKESFVEKIPALLSSLYGAGHFTALNLDPTRVKPLVLRR